LGLTWAGIVLTRADLVLFILPSAIYVVWGMRRKWRSLSLLGSSTTGPIVIWFAWSYATYGSLLPNTFYAKRNVEISTAELLFQGARYLVLSVANDPWTGLVLVTGTAAILIFGARFHKVQFLGVALYLLYIMYIGGDFMSGRFLSVPVYVTVLTAVMALSARVHQQRLFPSLLPRPIGQQTVFAIVLFGAIPLVFLQSMNQLPTALANPTFQRWDFGANAGIADERGFSVEQGRSLTDWYRTIGAQDLVQGFSAVDEADARLTIGDLRELSARWPQGPISGATEEFGIACGGLGSLAMSTGPIVHWVDPCGLTDAFLASVPYSAYNLHWRSGHFERDIPAGYLEALKNEDPGMIEDPEMERRIREIWARVRS